MVSRVDQVKMENQDNEVTTARTVNQVVMEKTVHQETRAVQEDQVIVDVMVNVVLKVSKDQKVHAVPLVM